MCDFGWCAEITKVRRNTLCGTFEVKQLLI